MVGMICKIRKNIMKFDEAYNKIVLEEGAKKVEGSTGEEILDSVIEMNRLGQKYQRHLRLYIPKIDMILGKHIKKVSANKTKPMFTTMHYELKNGILLDFWADDTMQSISIRNPKQTVVTATSIDLYDIDSRLVSYLKDGGKSVEIEIKIENAKRQYAKAIKTVEKSFQRDPEVANLIAAHMNKLDWENIKSQLGK
jgi:hypothetical protein